MTSTEDDSEVEHLLGIPGKKLLASLQNSKLPVLVDVGQSGLRGKLVVRKGDNPDHG